MSLDLHEDEIEVATYVASSVGWKWSRVRVEDVKSHLFLWLAENYKYVVRWREEGDLGRNKLRLSLRRAANRFCRTEFDVIKPMKRQWDYSTEAATQLLEASFGYDDWSEIAEGQSDVWAALTDITAAYETLSQVDRALIRSRLGDGKRYSAIAEEAGLSTPDAARMRVNRALQRVAERASSGQTARWPVGKNGLVNREVASE